MRSRKLAAIALIVVVVDSFAFVFVPAWLIQPFKLQTERNLELSYLLKRSAPWLTLVAFVFTLALAFYLWHGTRWWKRVGLGIAIIIASSALWFAHQNHFEWLFHPVKNPAYAQVSLADFVKDRDMVLGVKINGEAAAYPVRQLGYHHLVQDVVGGVPIVATY
jgi:hypothetical protein